MEQATDPKDWYQAQGAIKESRRLKHYDEVIQAAEDKMAEGLRPFSWMTTQIQGYWTEEKPLMER